MKSLRIFYYSCMLILLLGGIVTGQREWFLLFFVMLFVVAYAVALVLWTILSFSYIQVLPEHSAVKGRELGLIVEIHNDKPFPFTMMQVEIEAVCEKERQMMKFSLGSRETAEFRIPVTCAYRGRYTVGIHRVTVSDVFGLVSIPFFMEGFAYYRKEELKIYPYIREIGHLRMNTEQARFAGKEIRYTNEGDSPAALRAYQPGDSTKRIHWKKSMQKREIYVKQYEETQDAVVTIAIDTARHELEGEERLRCEDLVCEHAAAIAMYGLLNGYKVQVLDGKLDGKILEASGRKYFQEIHEYLVDAAFEEKHHVGARLLQEGASLRKAGYIYVVSLDADYIKGEEIEQLKRQGYPIKGVYALGELGR